MENGAVSPEGLFKRRGGYDSDRGAGESDRAECGGTNMQGKQLKRADLLNKIIKNKYG